MKLCFQDKTLRLPSNQDLILGEGDSNFYAQPVTVLHFKSPLTREQARWPNFFIAFFNVHIMNINYAEFQKKFDCTTSSRELP